MSLNLIAALYSEPWAITPRAFAAIEAIIQRHVAGDRLDEGAIRAAIEDAQASRPAWAVSAAVGDMFGGFSVREGKRYAEKSGTAFVPLIGPILSRANWVEQMCGATSPQIFEQSVRAAAADDDIERIVLGIDSPGGTVAGTASAGSAVREASEIKDVVAVADDLVASAAYWIASQASQVVVGDTAQVGSIGVVWHHVDESGKDEMEGRRVTTFTTGEHKAVGHQHAPLSEEGAAHIQDRLDGIHQKFVGAVAAGRRMDESEVSSIATGRVFMGEASVDNGLADTTGTLSDVLSGDTTTTVSMSAPAAPGKGGQHAGTQTTNSSSKMTTKDKGSAAETETPEDLTAAKSPGADPADIAAGTDVTKLIQQNQRLAAQVAALEGQVAVMRASVLEDRAQSVVDAILSDGKRGSEARESLLESCKDDSGAYSDSAISLIESVYAGVPKGAAVAMAGTVSAAVSTTRTDKDGVTSGEGASMVDDRLKARDQREEGA